MLHFLIKDSCVDINRLQKRFMTYSKCEKLTEKKVICFMYTFPKRHYSSCAPYLHSPMFILCNITHN